MKKYCIILLSLLSVIACEEPVTTSDYSVADSRVVVESIITNEKIAHAIKLSLPAAGLNETAEAVSDAEVFITSGDSIFYATESTEEPGTYMTTPFRAITGKLYTLTVRLGEEEFVGSDQSVPVEPLPAIQIRGSGDKQELQFLPSGQDPNFIDHQLTWDAPLCGINGCKGRQIFYDLKTIDVNEIYKPEKQEFYFPDGTIIIRKKHSVSPAFRGFLRSMLMETEWRGGVFDVSRANLPTNMSTGAIGFFAVSTVVSDTTIVE